MRKNTNPPERVRNGSIAFIAFIWPEKMIKMGQIAVRRHKYITFSDRKLIAELYRSNARPADIAGRLGVTMATIYRELKRGETTEADGAPILGRNQRRAYNPVIAQQTVQENIRRWGRTPADSLQGGFNRDGV